MTQEVLAARSGITQPTISRAQKGDDGSTLGVFKAVAAALDVPLADLFLEGRAKAETELVLAFRRLSPERQRGWLEMARLVASDHSPGGQEGS